MLKHDYIWKDCNLPAVCSSQKGGLWINGVTQCSGILACPWSYLLERLMMILKHNQKNQPRTSSLSSQLPCAYSQLGKIPQLLAHVPGVILEEMDPCGDRAPTAALPGWQIPGFRPHRTIGSWWGKSVLASDWVEMGDECPLAARSKQPLAGTLQVPAPSCWSQREWGPVGGSQQGLPFPLEQEKSRAFQDDAEGPTRATLGLCRVWHEPLCSPLWATASLTRGIPQIPPPNPIPPSNPTSNPPQQSHPAIPPSNPPQQSHPKIPPQPLPGPREHPGCGERQGLLCQRCQGELAAILGLSSMQIIYTNSFRFGFKF